MSDTSPRLDLPYIQPAQAQKHVTHNEALRVLDVLVQLTVAEFDATTPPALPVEGVVYALGAGSNGAWDGHDGALAVYVDGAWQFHTPQSGWVATLTATPDVRVWTGTAWEAAQPDQLDNLLGLGVNTTADSANRLAVSSPATLLTHEGDDHRLKINKAGAGDTASMLFQSGWSGRGEIGLIGDDDLAIKVSPDGSTFLEAIRVDGNTGTVRFPSGMAGTGSAAGVMGGQVIAITGERSSALVNGDFLSLGNGATYVAGAVMPFPGKVVAASMSIASGTAGINTLAVAVNRVENTAYQVSVDYVFEVGVGYSDFSAAPLAFAAGDALNLRVTATSGASRVVGTLFVVFD